jgi:hypothetical protein
LLIFRPPFSACDGRFKVVLSAEIKLYTHLEPEGCRLLQIQRDLWVVVLMI